MIHAEDGEIHISHTNRMEELGESEHSKGICLGALQYLGIRLNLSDMLRCKGNLCLRDIADRNRQERNQADGSNQCSVK